MEKLKLKQSNLFYEWNKDLDRLEIIHIVEEESGKWFFKENKSISRAKLEELMKKGDG